LGCRDHRYGACQHHLQRWREHGRMELRAQQQRRLHVHACALAPWLPPGVRCTMAVGGVAAGGRNQTATFAVTVINPVAAGVTQISNTASIADNGTNGAAPTPGNNSGSDRTPLTGAPDLSLTKSDGGASVAPGGTVGYTLTYANGGKRGAAGGVVTETVLA